ncbi:Carbonic anhydrase or acetyltransferase, isoleucine patch superfamily [Desulfotomaculum arcticum]|uniref:Carbonic anhydrase or acetyltransferase, isoleucine patch superfamily n=1 Tax=Desulfotruncus arcticus DSM 17038 TaxID=1121424 RepID=A0A1I2XL16_9FIRM|nr:gamma carbonic anhydrase family protein [Desulfotruncus arcticus]SFH14092.1 Carbonic anhydrase or acetyltransferase, isoleucine patch superfamily [Desulfotomaculum arcticum] [Desulfotruncus arcticus DSM 17038]
MICYSFGPHKPSIAGKTFIAPGVFIIGRVSIDVGASIWYNCVLRGDVSNIKVGRQTNIQDGCVLHGAERPISLDVDVGNYVTIGHSAILHGCKINDGAFIGMGAIILNRAVIGEGAIIGAGSLVPEGKEIPANVLAIGVPAKIIRAVTEEEKQRTMDINEAYYRRALLYKQAIKPVSISVDAGG